MDLGIIISTYQRKDGTTPFFLSRALESIVSQTYQNYKVFLIGDKYEDDDEFRYLATQTIPPNKIYYENLPVAVERDRYLNDGDGLWCAGGVNATNYGINKALELGYDYICHLDHDDWWSPQHLDLINFTIKNFNSPAFIYTLSTYGDSILPNISFTQIVESLPSPEKLIHSSVCINHKVIPLKYRDTLYEEGRKYPADADLWARIASFCSAHNYKSYLIPTLTCYHPLERH